MSDDSSALFFNDFSTNLARPRIAILGGGTIGLAIGWLLARAGCPVTLVERDQPGRGATHAAAGMLAAGIEAEPTEEALFQFGRLSQTLWPRFAHALTEASGLPTGYDATGTLVCAFTRDQAEKLRHGVGFQQKLGGRFDWLSAAEARRREPALAPSLVTAVFSPDDHQVDNRLLASALAAAFLGAGGTLVTETEASLDCAGGRVVGLVAGQRRFAADFTVLAAGAWSRLVPGITDLARPPVRPLKGQMLALAMPPEAPLIRHVVWGGACYLVPRADGRLIVGATTEERGFDRRITAGGVLGLLDDAWRTLPGIEDLEIQEIWTGFRPGSPDDMPILGTCGLDGLILATGHHRNGILLTPATAHAITETILTGKPPTALAPFALSRFMRSIP